MREAKTETRDVQLIEESCDVTGRLLCKKVPGKNQGEIIEPHFIVPLAFRTGRKNASGDWEVIKIPASEAPLATRETIIKLFGEELLAGLPGLAADFGPGDASAEGEGAAV